LILQITEIRKLKYFDVTGGHIKITYKYIYVYIMGAHAQYNLNNISSLHIANIRNNIAQMAT